MARAASALSPAVRSTRPQRVLRSAHTRNGANATPIRNRTLIFSASCNWGMAVHQPKSIAGRMLALGAISGLPRKKASPMPNSISAMPTAMSLTLGSPQITGMDRAKDMRP